MCKMYNRSHCFAQIIQLQNHLTLHTVHNIIVHFVWFINYHINISNCWILVKYYHSKQGWQQVFVFQRCKLEASLEPPCIVPSSSVFVTIISFCHRQLQFMLTFIIRIMQVRIIWLQYHSHFNFLENSWEST